MSYFNIYNQSRFEKIKVLDERIASFLTKKEIGILNTNIRSTHSYSKENYIAHKQYFSNDKSGIIDIIHKLYDKANLSENERIYHWDYYHSLQYDLHKEYKKVSKLIRQDNKTYINNGSGGSNANKIRYPKKCRKTAWKRFYKLFPHLKPKEELNNI